MVGHDAVPGDGGVARGAVEVAREAFGQAAREAVGGNVPHAVEAGQEALVRQSGDGSGGGDGVAAGIVLHGQGGAAGPCERFGLAVGAPGVALDGLAVDLLAEQAAGLGVADPGGNHRLAVAPGGEALQARRGVPLQLAGGLAAGGDGARQPVGVVGEGAVFAAAGDGGGQGGAGEVFQLHRALVVRHAEEASGEVEGGLERAVRGAGELGGEAVRRVRDGGGGDERAQGVALFRGRQTQGAVGVRGGAAGVGQAEREGAGAREGGAFERHHAPAGLERGAAAVAGAPLREEGGFGAVAGSGEDPGAVGDSPVVHGTVEARHAVAAAGLEQAAVAAALHAGALDADALVVIQDADDARGIRQPPGAPGLVVLDGGALREAGAGDGDGLAQGVVADAHPLRRWRAVALQDGDGVAQPAVNNAPRGAVAAPRPAPVDGVEGAVPVVAGDDVAMAGAGDGGLPAVIRGGVAPLRHPGPALEAHGAIHQIPDDAGGADGTALRHGIGGIQPERIGGHHGDPANIGLLDAFHAPERVILQQAGGAVAASDGLRSPEAPVGIRDGGAVAEDGHERASGLILRHRLPTAYGKGR